MSSFLGLTSLQTAHAKIVISTTKDYVENTLRKSQDYAERAADIALATALVESQLRVYANSSVPGSLSLAHDSIGHDHASAQEAGDVALGDPCLDDRHVRLVDVGPVHQPVGGDL